jgi:hypothetical protein
MPNPSTGIFLQGNSALGSGLLVVNGDGLLCVGTSIIRLAVKSGPGTVSYLEFLELPISLHGGVPFMVGGVRYYQGYYRNSAAFCTGATWNFSNAIRITWLP